jgi:hypothetical protein
MIENIQNITWEKYIEETDSSDFTKSDYIYRGQSNSYNFSEPFDKWKIISSFNRYYSRKNFRFQSFIGQQLEENLFKTIYGNYEFVKRTNLDKSDLITRLYFLQHYSIPTCLIDFTFNPLVALYFALSSLKGHQAKRFNNEGFPTIYPSECKISIYQINHKLLREVLKIKEIENTSNDLFLQYEKYRIDLYRNKFVYLGIDLTPHSKINPEIDNYNIREQNGCFILFDNISNNKYDLISFLEQYCKINKITFKEPLIKIYNIDYNNIYCPTHSKQSDYKPVFRFLQEKNITGKILFNDYQGLKYDFNFFHER